MKIKNILSLILLGITLQPLFSSSQLSNKVYAAAGNYNYMWWCNSVLNVSNSEFAIYTPTYKFIFDYKRLSFGNLKINREPVPEAELRYKSHTELFPSIERPLFDFGFDIDGFHHICASSAESVYECQLVASGRYYQQRFINMIPGLSEADPKYSGLDICSWPDRFSVILRVRPIKEMENRGLFMNLTLPSKYNCAIDENGLLGIKNTADGSGYIFKKSVNSTTMRLIGNTLRVSLACATRPAGVDMEAGMIVYPTSNVDSLLTVLQEESAQPFVITATQIAPKASPVEVVYEPDMGWHHVKLNNDISYTGVPPYGPNDRIDRVAMCIENTTNTDKNIRLNFSLPRNSSFGITGMSPMIRTLSGDPTGIPVQISKNWHYNPDNRQRYEGVWFYGLSMLTVPANTKIEIEFTLVYALWGTLPAASHAQLALPGYGGGNQLWDQAAIGSWGETFCFAPDLLLGKSPVLDIRPLLVHNHVGQEYNWTGNCGGADLFYLTRTDKSRANFQNMITQRKRSCPNMTEVTYSGDIEESLRIEYTTTIARSDDFARGIFKLKMKAEKAISFADFVVFQIAGNHYHANRVNKFSVGNIDGMLTEWVPKNADPQKYATQKVPTVGDVPWFSMTESGFPAPSTDKPANRGMIIRKWKARVNGVDNVPPYWAEYVAGALGDVGGEYPVSIFNITPPAGCTGFDAGDYIEAEIEYVALPVVKEEYYGPNVNFKKALQTDVDTWRLLYREVMGNNIQVQAAKGTVEATYPIAIRAQNDVVECAVTGGIGYVPITIKGLTGYSNPQLYELVGENWVKIDQSVYGNDFWQTDFDFATQTWEVTYNINLDTENDIRQTRNFKFCIEK